MSQHIQQDNLPQGLSIAGMIFGIVSIISCGTFSLVGLILSAVALSQCNKGVAGGRGMAMTGLILSILALIFSVIFTIIWIVFYGIMIPEMYNTPYYDPYY